jgi:hypothetical protein
MHDQIQFISNNITKSVNQIFENKTSVIDGLTFYLYNSIANTTHDKSTSYLNFNKQKDLEINCLLAVEANQIALIDENDNDQESGDGETERDLSVDDVTLNTPKRNVIPSVTRSKLKYSSEEHDGSSPVDWKNDDTNLEMDANLSNFY